MKNFIKLLFVTLITLSSLTTIQPMEKPHDEVKELLNKFFRLRISVENESKEKTDLKTSLEIFRSVFSDICKEGLMVDLKDLSSKDKGLFRIIRRNLEGSRLKDLVSGFQKIFCLELEKEFHFLMVACDLNKLKRVQYLVNIILNKKKLNKKKLNISEKSFLALALVVASSKGNLEIVKLLIKHFRDVMVDRNIGIETINFDKKCFEGIVEFSEKFQGVMFEEIIKNNMDKINLIINNKTGTKLVEISLVKRAFDVATSQEIKDTIKQAFFQ